MKVKVPKGSRQRRRASNTKLIDTAVISRISVIPLVGPLPTESIIGQGVINGEAYSVKKVSSENVKVSERMAGPSCRQDGVVPDLRHAARNDPIKTQAAHGSRLLVPSRKSKPNGINVTRHREYSFPLSI